MSYTKGKMTQGKSNTLLYVNDVNFGDVLVGGLSHEECEANAAELIHRWNCHDDLLAACKRGYQRLLELGQKESYITISMLSKAIAEAEKE